MKKLSLTDNKVNLLKNQTFNRFNPGTLLEDFTRLLDFVGQGGVPVSKKNQLLGMKFLADLNSRLSSPLEVLLKRPMQKSFPHINGLYLLLRASGLAYISNTGKKAQLILDEDALNFWNTLNPTERYFSLFQSWYYYGSPEIIGERPGWDLDYFFESQQFFIQLLGKGLNIETNNYDKIMFRYRPGLYNLALLELFGLIDVKRGKPVEGDTWPIVSIKPTSWGDALISFFSEKVEPFIYDENEKTKWETELKAHIPDWKNSLLDLETTSAPEYEGYVLKVELGKSYRKFAAPGDTTLDDLAYKILGAFYFDCDHLYQFIYKSRYGITEYVEGSHPYLDKEYESATESTTLNDLPLFAGMEFIFHFDFGDDWKFNIFVESLSIKKTGFTKLKLTEEKGDSPEQYPNWDEDY